MLVYVNIGKRDFNTDPIPPLDTVRDVWEFLACVDGGITPEGFKSRTGPTMRERTLFVFPPGHYHSWKSQGEIEKIVFHFTLVPPELAELLPRRGYYRVPLTTDDCDQLRQWATGAAEHIHRLTVKSAFRERMLAQELSHLALREVPDQPLAAAHLANAWTDRAMAWFADHMAEGPGLREVSHALNISPTHLRRIFHKTRKEGPHAAFHRIRMQRTEDLLLNSDLTMEVIAERVGLSSASALNRTVKNYFGIPPHRLRKHRQGQRDRGQRMT